MYVTQRSMQHRRYLTWVYSRNTYLAHYLLHLGSWYNWLSIKKGHMLTCATTCEFEGVEPINEVIVQKELPWLVLDTEKFQLMVCIESVNALANLLKVFFVLLGWLTDWLTDEREWLTLLPACAHIVLNSDCNKIAQGYVILVRVHPLSWFGIHTMCMWLWEWSWWLRTCTIFCQFHFWKYPWAKA